MRPLTDEWALTPSMPRRKVPCPTCGAPKVRRTARCRRCYLRDVAGKQLVAATKDECPRCGKRKFASRLVCGICYSSMPLEERPAINMSPAAQASARARGTYEPCSCGGLKRTGSEACARCYWEARRRSQAFRPIDADEYDFRRISAMRRRERHLLKKYGLTKEAYEDLYRAQSGCCAICGETFISATLTHGWPTVDHDHATGAVRGLLCDLCNKGLGQFKDSPALLTSARTYLERHRG
jgi:hypothetical protein